MPHRKDRETGAILRVLMLPILVGMLIGASFLTIRFFVLQPFRIPSGSMEPTLLPGDHIIVNKLPGARTDIRHWDVIVFPLPNDPQETMVKRVVGLPGDVVELRDKILYVNRMPLEEDYVVHKDSFVLPLKLTHRDNTGPIRVPPNTLFVLGDNRDASFDSRFWGLVDAGSVIGLVKRIYWSWDEEKNKVRWRRIGKPVR